MRTELDRLLTALARVEERVAEQAEVFEDPDAYLAGARDVCALFVDEVVHLADRDRTPDRPGPTDLAAGLGEVLAELRPALGTRPVELQVRTAPVPVALSGAEVLRLVDAMLHCACRGAARELPTAVVVDADDREAVLDVGQQAPAGIDPVSSSASAGSPERAAVARLARAHGGRLDGRGDPATPQLRVRLPLHRGPGERVVTVPELLEDHRA